jgi:hypothetical protein
MTRISRCLMTATLMLLSIAAAVPLSAQCSNNIPANGACGYVFKQYANGSYATPTRAYYVKFSPYTDGSGGSVVTTGTYVNGQPDYSLFFVYNLQANTTYYVFIWNDAEHWGSPTVPIDSFQIALNKGIEFYGLHTTPSPLPPTVVTPYEGQINVGSSVNLQWTDGLDNDRRNSSWPVTYDIYASGNEFPETLAYSNVPCNGVGTCNLYTSGLVYTTRYQWRVVAKLSGYSVSSDHYYKTSSAPFHFSTTWDPGIPIHTFRTINGSNLLKAANGGGGSFDATGASSNYETQFVVQDVNGGTLYSGDQVHIQTNRNYFMTAVNGGCPSCGVNASSSWTMSYQTWTIIRVAGFGPINPGDQVAFQSTNGYYMSAEGGGGQAVNANRTAIGAWETFTFQ